MEEVYKTLREVSDGLLGCLSLLKELRAKETGRMDMFMIKTLVL